MANKFTGEDRDQLYELLQKLSGAVAELSEPAAEDAAQPEILIAEFLAEYRYRILPRLFPGDDPDADEDYRDAVHDRN